MVDILLYYIIYIISILYYNYNPTKFSKTKPSQPLPLPGSVWLPRSRTTHTTHLARSPPRRPGYGRTRDTASVAFHLEEHVGKGGRFIIFSEIMQVSTDDPGIMMRCSLFFGGLFL